MEWQIKFDTDFESWFDAQSLAFRKEAFAVIGLLKSHGASLGRPRVDTVKGSRFKNMKELRIQFKGRPYRLLFAFDPERNAMILVGGDRGGDKRWYEKNIPIADERYQKHLDSLKGVKTNG